MLSTWGVKHSDQQRKHTLMSTPSRPQREFLLTATEILYDSQKVLLPEAYGSIDFMPDHSEL